MRFAIIGTALLATAAVVPAAAQNPPPAPAVVRTVIAGTKLPDLGAAPLYFSALAVAIPAGAASRVAAAPNGVLYQLAGSTEISTDGENKTLMPGEGLFIAGGHNASLKAGSDGPSRTLHFLLIPAPALDKPVEGGVRTTSAGTLELEGSDRPVLVAETIGVTYD
jgi:glyoxylate utilization-related uncharacterized protein